MSAFDIDADIGIKIRCPILPILSKNKGVLHIEILEGRCVTETLKIPSEIEEHIPLLSNDGSKFIQQFYPKYPNFKEIAKEQFGMDENVHESEEKLRKFADNPLEYWPNEADISSPDEDGEIKSFLTNFQYFMTDLVQDCKESRRKFACEADEIVADLVNDIIESIVNNDFDADKDSTIDEIVENCFKEMEIEESDAKQSCQKLYNKLLPSIKQLSLNDLNTGQVVNHEIQIIIDELEKPIWNSNLQPLQVLNYKIDKLGNRYRKESQSENQSRGENCMDNSDLIDSYFSNFNQDTECTSVIKEKKPIQATSSSVDEKEISVDEQRVPTEELSNDYIDDLPGTLILSHFKLSTSLQRVLEFHL